MGKRCEAFRLGRNQSSHSVVIFSRGIAMPSGSETISAPGPGTESTCIRIPAVSIAAILSWPVSASAGGLMALKVAVPGAGDPLRSKVARSIRLRRSGKVKCVLRQRRYACSYSPRNLPAEVIQILKARFSGLRVHRIREIRYALLDAQTRLWATEIGP